MTTRRPVCINTGAFTEIPDGDALPAALLRDPGGISSGETTLPRALVASNGLTSTSGSLRLAYFTAVKSETTTQVCVPTASTAAGATPTLCRIGLWTVDASDNGTALVASVANDTTLWASTNSSSAGTRSWSTSYVKVAGQRYALGFLVVTAAAAPTMPGVAIASGMAAEVVRAPRLTGTLTGQTDLPSSFLASALSGSLNYYYAAILP